MGLLFDKSIAVSFGRPNELGQRFTDLFTTFAIEMGTEPTPNVGEISIYNLNSTTRALLQQEKKELVLRLEVGYQGILEELYFGDISQVFVEKQGPDIITKIKAGSGRRTYQGATVNESLAAGSTTKQVIEILARSMDVTVGAIKGVTEEVFQHGITLSGPVRDRLDEAVKKMGLEWNIQNGALQILPPDTPSENLGILLTKETGLIGRPIEREQDEKQTGKTIEFTSLLRTRFIPGVAVEVRSEQVNGFFKIRKSKFQGDNRKGRFAVTCESSEINPTISVPNQTLNI